MLLTKPLSVFAAIVRLNTLPLRKRSDGRTLFQSLETNKAFLTPDEITELRTTLGLSMEDFARLIGATRQSISAWEKAGRASLPSRTADLLMRLVRQALHTETVDVISVLLEEAKKWGIVIQMRGSAVPVAQSVAIVLRPKSKRPHTPLQQASGLSLAAEADVAEEMPYIVETTDGRPSGVLRYDYEQAALVLDITGSLPPWEAVDVELETQDGQHLTSRGFLGQGHCLLLLTTDAWREKDIAQIALKVPPQERKDNRWTAQQGPDWKLCYVKSNFCCLPPTRRAHHQSYWHIFTED